MTLRFARRTWRITKPIIQSKVDAPLGYGRMSRSDGVVNPTMNILEEIKQVIISRLNGNEDLVSLILALMIRIVEEQAVLFVQGSARAMIRDVPRRKERVMVRWAETVLSAREEPVVIVNSKWRWRWKRRDYYPYAESMSLASEANVRTLAFRPRSTMPERPFAFADWAGNHTKRYLPFISIHRFL